MQVERISADITLKHKPRTGTQAYNMLIESLKAEIQEIDEVMECYSIGGIYDFFLKVVVKDLAAYDQFVFNKLTKVNGIVKMQSSFVLNEIKHTTALKVVPGE